MRIKVLHVIDHLGYGGAPVAVKNIVENIGADIECCVCALRQNTNPLPIKGRIINLDCRKYDPRAILQIARICKEHNIDILHAHLEKSTVTCLVASSYCNPKVIIHEHGPVLMPWTGPVYRLFLKFLGQKASAVIANSNAARKALLKAGGFDPGCVHVIANFVDITRHDPRIYNRTESRQQLGLKENEIVVGFVGRLNYYKGADLMLDAAAQLLKEYDKYHFVIVGDGKEKKCLLRQSRQLGLEEKVTFTGICENPAQMMRAFDIGLIPSRREAFGITAVEFMQMGVSIIASPVGGLVELVQDGKTGIVLNRLEADCIAEAIKRLGEDRQLRSELAANAQVFSNRFDGKQQLKQLEDIYMTLAGSRAPDSS